MEKKRIELKGKKLRSTTYKIDSVDISQKKEILDALNNLHHHIVYIDDLILNYLSQSNLTENALLEYLWELHSDGKILLIRGRIDDGSGHKIYKIHNSYYSTIQILRR